MDLFNEFIEFDVIMGSDVVKCPNCGASVARSLILDDEVECPECGEEIKSA